MKRILILLSVAVLIQAQPFGMENKEIENFRIMKMTEHMDLSPEQADKFFPRLRKHRNEVHNLHLKMRAFSEEISTENGMIPENLSGKKLDELTQELRNLEDRETELRREFRGAMEGYLKPFQIARYMTFEQKFRRELQQTMKHRMNKMKNRR